jgi:acyl-CoA synthetase (AMP-forming)/AMP-acid ligase II
MPLLYDWLQRAVRDRGASGSGTALVYRDTYLSWRGLAHRVDRRAQELASYGVSAGAWVGLMLGNVPDFVVLALAVSKLRAVLVPIDPTTGTRDLDMILDAAPLRALVTRPRGSDSIPPGAAAPVATTARGTGRPYQARFVPESRKRLQGTLLNCNLFKREPLSLPGIEPAVVLFTTDAGGDPKGVVRGDGQLDAVATSIGATLDLKATDQVLAIAPLHHGYGLDFGLLAALAQGATLYLDDEMEPRRLAKALREQTITLFPGTPAIFGALARAVAVKPIEHRPARLLCSGSALPAAISDGVQERFGVPLLSCFHTTEAGPLTVDLSGATPAAVGRPFSGVELRLAGADGGAIAPPGEGPIWVRAGAVSNVFVPELAVRPKAATVPIGRAAPDGWFRTGDVGRVDGGGELTLVGREDDLVKVDGKRVALGEVEGCLESFAKVREAQARVVTGDLGETYLVARVVTAGEC